MRMIHHWSACDFHESSTRARIGLVSFSQLVGASALVFAAWRSVSEKFWGGVWTG